MDHEEVPMKRRSFLQVVGGAAGAGALGHSVTAGPAAPVPAVAGMPRRTLGRTGEQISIIGFPGLGLVRDDQDTCTAAIHDAFKRGINYFDVAPAYGNGSCETKMGIGLQGVDRDKIFLACKTKKRDKAGAREELERSLKLLKTDRFDLYQLHALRTPEEVKQALGPGGAIETFKEAKKEGKVRFFGFSAHTTKGALEAMKGFRFDTVMFPINFVEMFALGFGTPILTLAKEQGAAILAIKPMSRGRWRQGEKRTRKWWYRCVESNDEIDLALRFTLSRDCVTAGVPPAWLDLLDKAIDAGKRFRPITEAEVARLRALAVNCESVFRREEEAVARGGPWDRAFYPDSPHEGCPGAYA
jgi:predicted aldo/keto reductase-like oxidoreductase